VVGYLSSDMENNGCIRIATCRDVAVSLLPKCIKHYRKLGGEAEFSINIVSQAMVASTMLDGRGGVPILRYTRPIAPTVNFYATPFANLSGIFYCTKAMR